MIATWPVIHHKYQLFAVCAALIASMLIPSQSLAASPSFNCSKAETPVEIAICNTGSLAEQDLELTKAYKSAVTNNVVTPAEQGAWIKQREQICGSDVQCISAVTQNRITQLEANYAAPKSSAVTVNKSGPTLLNAEDVTEAWKNISREERNAFDLLARGQITEAKELIDLLGLNFQNRKPVSSAQMFFFSRYRGKTSHDNLNFFFKEIGDSANFAFPQKTAFFEWTSGPTYVDLCDAVINTEEYKNHRRLADVADDVIDDFVILLNILQPNSLDPDILGEIAFSCISALAQGERFARYQGADALILTRILEILASYGANFNWVGNDRHPITSLWVAIERNKPIVVRRLLDLGADPKVVHMERKEGNIIGIHRALSVWQWPAKNVQIDQNPYAQASIDVLRMLLDAGVSANEPYNNRGYNGVQSFVERARSNSNLAVLRELKDRGLL